VNADLVDTIDALLPQTQCTKCGYDGCRPYAQAIALDEADINQCPPGGRDGIHKLAQLLKRAEIPLNPANGIESPRVTAVIDETRCIGCMLCIKACPVDAIVGAAKRMHTVLTASCTGCDLCLPPCPVDCIDLVELDALARQGNEHAATQASRSIDDVARTSRERFGFRQARVAREHALRHERLALKAKDKLAGLEQQSRSQDLDRKKATIQAALERARARRLPQ
jgi:electron transport complex protein RnfB